MKRILLLLSLVLFASCDNSDDVSDINLCQEIYQKTESFKNSIDSGKLSQSEIENLERLISELYQKGNENGCNF